MKRCDKCGFESHGCAPGLEFMVTEIEGIHTDMCEKCGNEYWEGVRKASIPFKQQWLKEMNIKK